MESITVCQEDNALRVSWEGSNGIPGCCTISTSASSQLNNVDTTRGGDAIYVNVSYDDDGGTYVTYLTFRPIDMKLMGLVTYPPMEIG